MKFFVTNLRVYDYRATPHISKGFSPNELMGFDDKQWLPSHHNTIPNEEMKSLAKQNDAIAKANQKKYNDVHTKQRSPFKPSDIVLCKQKRPNKFSPYFSPIPYEVTAVKGSMVTAKITYTQPHEMNHLYSQINYQIF